MATTITNNLYPPYIDSYMPAFDYAQNCKVYFSIPEIIDRDDLNGYVQISLVDSQTNANQLNTSQYPGGVKRTKWAIDEHVSDDDKYYVEIEPSDLIGTTINFNYSAATSSPSYSLSVTHDIVYNDNPEYNKNGSVDLVMYFSNTDNAFKNTRMTLSKDGTTIGYFYIDDEGNWNFNNTTTSDKVLYYGKAITITQNSSTSVSLNFATLNSGDYSFETNFNYSVSSSDLPHLCYIEDNTVKYTAIKSFSISDDDLTKKGLSILASNESLNLYDIENISETIDSYYNDKFKTDGYYRLQMRFEHADTGNPPRTGVTAKWLSLNRDYFSEWSTVCILRAIVPPTLILDDFRTKFCVYKDVLIHINNQVSFSDSITGDTTIGEYVTKYRVRLTKRASELYNSDWMIPSVDNTVIDEVEYALTNTDDNKWYYVLKIDIITNNLYQTTFEYPFYTSLTLDAPPVSLFTATVDNDNGGIRLYLKTTETEDSWNKYYIIRRADDTTDFKLWEIVKKIFIPENHVYQYTCYDYTCEVGTFYKYQIQTCDATESTFSSFYDAVGLYDDDNETKSVFPHPSDLIGEDEDSAVYIFNSINNIGNTGFVDSIIGNEDSDDFYVTEESSSSSSSSDSSDDTDDTKTMIMPYLDDIFLTNGDHCLCIKYDPDLGSITYNINESVTQTIGSKYPFVTRSGLNNYKTFNLSGTIAAEMDENNMFTSKAAIYGNYADSHSKFNKNKNINSHYDYIYERKFREKVMNFLTDGKVKLYKSTQEGNMLIRLTDISITPKTEIGRLIYTFSATATEVDECKIKTYNKHNIQDINVKLKTLQVVSLGAYLESSEQLYLYNDYFVDKTSDPGYYKIIGSSNEAVIELVSTEKEGVYEDKNGSFKIETDEINGDSYLVLDENNYKMTNNERALFGYEILVEED